MWTVVRLFLIIKPFRFYSCSCRSKPVWHALLCGTTKEMFRRMSEMLISMQWKWNRQKQCLKVIGTLKKLNVEIIYHFWLINCNISQIFTKKRQVIHWIKYEVWVEVFNIVFSYKTYGNWNFFIYNKKNVYRYDLISILFVRKMQFHWNI